MTRATVALPHGGVDATARAGPETETRTSVAMPQGGVGAAARMEPKRETRMSVRASRCRRVMSPQQAGLETYFSK